MKKIVIFFIVIFFCIAILYLLIFKNTVKNKSYESIQIKGSDTIVSLVQLWAECFIKKYPMYNISIIGGGSGVGFASLINGTCDIAMSSRQVNKNEKLLAYNNNVNLTEFKVGLDGLAVIVNKNNPVSGLTLKQLRDIFVGKIVNWKEIHCGKNEKIVVLSRESNSGTYVFFKECILKKNEGNICHEFSIHSLMMASSQAIHHEVSQNSNAIGYIGMGFLDNKVKVIAIAANKTSKYIYPTIKNVKNNLYPISRPLYLYTKDIKKTSIKNFIEYVLSVDGQKITSRTDFVSII
ncbi:MAG: phosphate ABC transporter substrate-binding protein [Endomicrobium sp.]|nr:phosphate ABC transporter substrate-binding protein [Endomicrobium sp.]